MAPRETKALIREIAGQVGFTAVGITTADPIDGAHLKSAIASGRIAGMAWLARGVEGRCDPRSLLPGARSVICCALAYGERGIEDIDHPPLLCKEGQGEGDHRSTPPRPSPYKRGGGGIARFARGAEYHLAVRERLGGLWAGIQKRFPSARAKICVDTSPILEKAFAQRAGLGWIGKQTLLVSECLGSWSVLGEIVTDLEIEPDAPAQESCGECRACIDACPTGALIAPRVLDSRRCLAYLTIERDARLKPPLTPPSPLRGEGQGEGGRPSRVSGLQYGCDRCQEACPYNAQKNRSEIKIKN